MLEIASRLKAYSRELFVGAPPRKSPHVEQSRALPSVRAAREPLSYRRRQRDFEAARITRPDLKLLFVKGFANNAAIGNGQLENGMEVITKPFVVSELANKITDVIEGRASSQRDCGH